MLRSKMLSINVNPTQKIAFYFKKQNALLQNHQDSAFTDRQPESLNIVFRLPMSLVITKERVMMVKRGFTILFFLFASSGILAQVCDPSNATGQCGFRDANGNLVRSAEEVYSSYQQQNRTTYTPLPSLR